MTEFFLIPQCRIPLISEHLGTKKYLLPTILSFVSGTEDVVVRTSDPNPGDTFYEGLTGKWTSPDPRRRQEGRRSVRRIPRSLFTRRRPGHTSIGRSPPLTCRDLCSATVSTGNSSEVCIVSGGLPSFPENQSVRVKEVPVEERPD